MNYIIGGNYIKNKEEIPVAYVCTVIEVYLWIDTRLQ